MNIDPASHEEKLKQAERIAYLIAGHLKGTLTNEEADELDNWITASDENLELFENLTDEDNIDAGIQGYLAAERRKAEAFTELKNSISAGKRQGKRRLWTLVTVAVVILAASSTYFLVQRHEQKAEEKPVAQSTTSGDILSGSTKAVLTLSNGRTVILNENSQETISDDAGVSMEQKNGALIYSGNPNSMAYNTVSTPRGGQFQMLLADGTRVWLNADSYLKYPAGLATAQRTLELRGEAYFEVAKDPARPFVVTMLASGGQRTSIEVLGTHFNVAAYNDNDHMETTLVEGSIRISSEKDSVMLKPGQQATIGRKIAVTKVNPAESVAWKNGKFLFRDATITSIGNQIKRWYDVDVRMEGNIDQHFNMEISRQVPLSRLVAALERTGQVRFLLKDKTLIIRP